jgi:hypothetical protein
MNCVTSPVFWPSLSAPEGGEGWGGMGALRYYG